ncbi:hypothetical protein IW136_001916 [Coemansia sp. RSA 678]|nr:hypothetical protein IW136_001916 [Coemansia sp. RSA 678]
MTSRLLLQSGTLAVGASSLAVRASTLTTRASSLTARVGRRRVHTSNVQASFLEKLGLFMRPGSEAEAYVEPRSQPKVSIIERLGAMRRRGGYGLGGGMPLYVPIKAKNVEKAWGIWAKYLRYPDPTVPPPSRDSLVDMLMLVVNAVIPRTAGIITEAIRSKQPIAGFRTAVILRHIFAKSTGSEQAGHLSAFDLRLDLDRPEDYKHIIELLRLAVDSRLPGGNTRTIGELTADELELEANDMEVSRLVQVLIQAAIQDGVEIDIDILRATLDVMITTQDVTAACDTLAECYPDLALLLDPQAQVSAKVVSRVLDDPQSELCQMAIGGLLQLVAVGTDPKQLGVDPRQPQEDMPYAQLEDVVDFSDKQPTAEEMKAVHAWRTATAERIYRAFVSAGISQVPAPDNSPHSALQGSVVPTPEMVSSVLNIYLAAGDVEQAALYYEALKAVLNQQSAQVQSSSWNAAGCEELKSEHKMGSRLWADIAHAACRSGQLWLAAQILGDMAGDGWAPLQSVYEQYIDAVSDPNEASLATAMRELQDRILANGISVTNLAVREPLICALTGQRDVVPKEFLTTRIEQAIVLFDIPNAEDIVSDETARDILSALIASGQLTRAQDLADTWSSGRPNLVTHQFAAELVRGLGRAGDHTQALELFSNYQHLDEGESTLDMLCAVLEVYMRAGDFAEAISVGKRIRTMVNANPHEQPERETYNYLLSAYCQKFQPSEAMCVLEEMRRYKVHANSDTYAVLAQSMSTLRSLDGMRLVSALANVDYNMALSESEQSTATYSRPLPLGIDYYNNMIEAFGRTAEPMLALQVWEVMRFRGVRPNHLTATLLMDTCAWCERVHWEDDMKPQEVFVNHEVPDDYVYMGMKLMYYHFLGSALQQLQQAGLEFSLANYQQMVETLLRGAFLDDAVTMMIGRFEGPEKTAEWIKRTYDVRFERVNPLIRDWVKKNTPPATEGGKEITEHAVTRFMTDYMPPIPLCKETVATAYGATEVLRSKFVSEDDPRVEVQLAYRSKDLVFDILDLHERRLDQFLAAERPDLLPESRRQKMRAAEQT